MVQFSLTRGSAKIGLGGFKRQHFQMLMRFGRKTVVAFCGGFVNIVSVVNQLRIAKYVTGKLKVYILNL